MVVEPAVVVRTPEFARRRIPFAAITEVIESSPVRVRVTDGTVLRLSGYALGDEVDEALPQHSANEPAS